MGGRTCPSPCLLGSGRTVTGQGGGAGWVWPPVPGDTWGWRPRWVCGAEPSPDRSGHLHVRQGPASGRHQVASSLVRQSRGAPACVRRARWLRRNLCSPVRFIVAAVPLATAPQLCREAHVCRVARGSPPSHQPGNPVHRAELRLREAGAGAWGHAAHTGQFEEPTARFVPPRVLGPARVRAR